MFNVENNYVAYIGLMLLVILGKMADNCDSTSGGVEAEGNAPRMLLLFADFAVCIVNGRFDGKSWGQRCFLCLRKG